MESNKGMTLEEAKREVSIKRGYESYSEAGDAEIINSNFGLCERILTEAAELYLSSNTAALREENEQLRKENEAFKNPLKKLLDKHSE